MTRRIDAIYAWIATEPDGGEGVCAHSMPRLGLVPLVGADRERVESLRPFARAVAKQSGCPVRLVCFTTRNVLEGEP